MKIRTALFRCLCFSWAFLVPWAANSQNNGKLWTSIDEQEIDVRGKRYIIPTSYETHRLDINQLDAILKTAPMERSPITAVSNTILTLPLPDGTFKDFDIVESPIMAPELSAKFPEITTYAGVAVDDPGMYLRMDRTPQGFHGMILVAGGSTIYIDPYSFGGGDIDHYLTYYRKDFVPIEGKVFECGVVSESKDEGKSFNPMPNLKASFGTCELRTYRCAVAATGEYTIFHGGTVALAQAAQVTTMNRVNAVYERDMAIRLELVANNNLIVYDNATTDPYTNGATGTMINENQTNVDAVIGSANYDIGHVFGTNSGGLAQLQSVCNNAGKARGVTGSGAPVGDPFDIDYVCHEVGHQFGGNHTQNNNCNRNNGTAFEPGSASTIMGYAGICAPNVQSNSDDHFHGGTMEEMGNFITGGGHTCPVTTALTNNPPTITGTNVSTGLTVPANTPFALTAIATDPDANTLSYCWEQMDVDVATMPPVATSTVGPNFRSFSPSTDPTRHFPNLADQVAGTVSQWEVLPSVTRTMDFRLTVRDNAPGGGCNDHSDVTLNIDGNSGPFLVTNPNATGITWAALTNETVTWDVAGTDNAPVSCANVNILLSLDGGLTYPITLATNTPNDGTETILVPNNPTTTARVRVVCADNIFYDISDNDFEITAATFDYSLSATNTAASACPPNAATYTIDVGSIGGYNDPVALTVTGVPTGATASFSPATVTPAGTATLTVTTGTAASGVYNLTVEGASTSGNKTLGLTLTVSDPAPSAVTLTAPTNGATNQAIAPTLTWSVAAGTGVTYEINIATDAGFTNIVDNAAGLTTNSYTSLALSPNTTYFWQVQASNACGVGAMSSMFSFTTGNTGCTTTASTDIPVTIDAVNVVTVTSNNVIALPAGATITDVNVLGLDISHTYIQDLTITLTSPVGTAIDLMTNACTNQDDINMDFDDAAATAYAALPCPPIGGVAVQPENALAGFNGEDPNGTWILTVDDNFAQDGGAINAWSLEICYSITSSCTGFSSTASVTSNLNGQQVSCAGSCDGTALVTATGGTAPYTYLWSTGATTDAVTGLCAGTYTVTTTDANACTDVQTITVSDPAALVAAVTGTNNASCGTCPDGDMTASGTGGTGAYTFLWDAAAANQTTATATNLVPGTYCVTVGDANGCTDVVCSSIAASCNLTATTNTTDVLCNGDCTGTATVTATLGTLPYTFQWDAGTGNQTTQTATGLCAGTYTVTTTDANGCTDVQTVTITEPTALVVTIGGTTDPSCPTCTDGDITALASGGTAPYTYLWDAAGGNQPTQTATNVGVGNPCVTVTDVNGCTATICGSVTFTGTCSINSTATVVNNTSCNGACDGSATATGITGTAPYTYLWDAGTGNQTTQTASGLCVGTYTVTTTDVNGCTSVQTVTITEPTAVTGAITGTTSPSCPTCTDGDITAVGSGGTAPYTYVWDATVGNQTTQTATNVGVGNPCVTITDANGCTTVICGSVTFTGACSIGSSATVNNNVSCNGVCDGSATAAGITGTAPYTYSWDAGAGNQTTQTATNLCAGTYTVTITDVNGCTGTETVIVTEPAAILTATAAVSSPISCNGACDGEVIVVGAGGTAPYTYVWSNLSTTQSVNGLCAGTYTVTTTDINGCTDVQTVVVTEPTLLVSGIASSTNPSCPTCNDGDMTATVTGGTGPYTFVWTNGQTTATATNLTVGTHCVTITDANGCTTTACGSLNAGACTLVSTTNTTDVTCNGACDGTVLVVATAGTMPYTYAWSNGASTDFVGGLCAGTYTVTTTDANGCTDVQTVTIIEPAPLVSGIASSTNPSCPTCNDGDMTATVTGGTGPYTYVWTNGQTTATATNLIAGTHCVTITDANGCTTTACGSLNVGTCSVVAATTVDNNVSCNGACDGQATANGTGGTAPYTYLWNTNGFFQTTQTAIGLCAGTYDVTVTDVNGCSDVQTVTITEPASLTIAVTGSTNPSCPTCADGQATATGSGGTGPYTYAWSGGQATQTATNLAAMTHCVTVTDANGCSESTCVTLTANSCTLVSTTNTTDVTCNGACDGTALVVATAGTMPYTYAWSNGASTDFVGGLCAGTYTVTTTDANGCADVQTVIITEPAPLVSGIASSTNVTCATCADGDMTATVTGGTGPYTFVWANGQTTATATNLTAGTHCVTITDANGCTTTSCGTLISIGCSITSTVVVDNDASCNGVCDGQATATGTSGTAPYTFVWDINGGFQTTQTATGLCAGTYTVTITDVNGCSDVQTVTITEPTPVLSTVVNQTDVTCAGACDGTADIQATGGTGVYTFLWSNGQTTQTATGLCAGTYTVTTTDANGCTDIFAVVINEPTALLVTGTTVGTTCAANDGSATVVATGGTAPYTYAWDNGGTTATITNLVPNPYVVTVTDANGCVAIFTVLVDNACVCNIGATATSTTLTCNGSCDGTATATGVNGLAPYTYAWSGGQTTQTATGLCAGTYLVTVTDANACSAVATVVVNQPDVLVANAANTVNATCAGNDGEASVLVTGGTAPYTYSWSNGATTQVATGLATGIRQVTVTDANGCTAQGIVNVGLNNTLSTSNAVVVQNVTCNGGNDGSAFVVAAGASGITYAWDNGETTSTATQLTAGVHTVTVSTAGGCTSVQTVTLTEPPAIVTSFSTTFTPCVDGTGEIVVNASGGNIPYTFSWNNGVTSHINGGLSSGTYTVTVTDAIGCTVANTELLNIGIAPSVQFAYTEPLCSGDATGAIDLTVTPVGNYVFSWSNGANTEDISGLTQGSYTVFVTDPATGCTTNFTDTLDGPAPFLVSVSETPPTTPNANDGSVAATANGGTAPYTYLWDNGATTEVQNGINAGTYTVTVTDANGCTATASVVVNALTGIQDIDWLTGFEVMPNPNDGYFNVRIELATPQTATLRINDVLGRVLYEETLNGDVFMLPIEAYEWASGAYFIQLTTDESQAVRKVIVTRP